jgi:hypothetical protein
MTSSDQPIYIHGLILKAINERNYNVLEFIHKNVDITYTKELLVELVKSQDVEILNNIGNTKTNIVQKELEEELVDYYINTKYLASSLDFIRHPFLDKLLALRLIDINSFAEIYHSALNNTQYDNCNADILYLITTYLTYYDNDLFTMEKLDKYCSMLNWKMIALSILHKTRVFADSLYNTSKYKLNIINLMNTVITIAQDQDQDQYQYHKNMSNRLLRILTKELIILLEII